MNKRDANVSKQLVNDFRGIFSEKNLRRMMQFNDVFPDFNNLVSLIRQLSWTHFIVLIPIKVAEYITEILPKELLQKKSHKFYLESKNLIENRGKFDDE